MPASSVDIGVPPMLWTIHPGMHAGRRRAAVGIDGGDDELLVDHADVEAGLAAQIDAIARACPASTGITAKCESPRRPSMSAEHARGTRPGVLAATAFGRSSSPTRSHCATSNAGSK